MWFNPTFEGYNERKVEMARTRSADDRLPKIILVGQTKSGFRAKRKVDRLRMGWGDFVRKDLREMGASLEGLKARH